MNITLLPQYLIETLGWTLIHWLWQGLAVAIILAVLLKAFANISSSKRYLVGCAGLTAMMVMPMLTFKVLSSRWEEPIKVANVEVKRADIGQLAAIEMPVVESDAPVIEEAAEPVIEISFRERACSLIEANASVIVYSWLIGVFGFTLWHLGGWRQLQKLRRTMVKPVGKELLEKMNKLADAIGVKRAVTLAESALVAGPIVVGWLKPMILLPGSVLTGLSPEQIEAILAHELAHVKRCDYLVNIIQTAVEIVGFYNPAIWWVSAKIRAERENCCDDVAVALTGDKVSYVRALTTLEEVRSGYKLAVAGSGGSLFDRAKRLLTKDRDISGEKSLLTAAVAVLLLLMVAIPAGFAMSSKADGKVDFVRRGEYKVILDNGIGVELVGVREYPSAGKKWRSPDGKLLGYDIITKDSDIITEDDEDYESEYPGYELVCKIDGEDYDYQFDGVSGFKGGVGLEVLAPGGMVGMRVHVKDDVEKTNLKVGVATGEWKVLAIHDGKGTDFTNVKKNKIVFSPANENQDGLVITVSDNFVRGVNSVRLDAISKTGALYQGCREAWTNAFSNLGQRTVIFKDLLLEDVKEFQFKARPFQWVEFKNVLLKADNQAEVQVEKTDNAIEDADEIKQAAEALFYNIQNADYEHVLSYYENGKWTKDGWKNLLPANNYYMAYTEFPSWVKWICETFKDNSIVSVELGDVFLSDKKIYGMENETWPTVPYKLVLEDGGIIEDDLLFRHVPARKGLMSGIHNPYYQAMLGLDWHLQDEPIKNFESQTDIKPSDFKLLFDSKRSVYDLVVSMKNDSDVVMPEFKLRYYRGDVEVNLDEAGNKHSGWHEAGPIEPGKQWNESTRGFGLPDGEYEFTVVLDYDNKIAESDENNNTASIKVVIKDGRIVSQQLITAEVRKAEKQIIEFKAKLEQPVTVDIDESPDGSGLTVQYAVIAICKAADVPYNWDKSARATDPQRRKFIGPLKFKNKIASQKILDLTSLAGLAYGVDAGGVYLYKPEKVSDVQSNLEIVDAGNGKAGVVVGNKLNSVSPEVKEVAGFVKGLFEVAAYSDRGMLESVYVKDSYKDIENDLRQYQYLKKMGAEWSNTVPMIVMTLGNKATVVYVVNFVHRDEIMFAMSIFSLQKTNGHWKVSQFILDMSKTFPEVLYSIWERKYPDGHVWFDESIADWRKFQQKNEAARTDFRRQKENTGPSGNRPKGNCVIAGKVVSAETSEPIGNAKVYLFYLGTHAPIFIDVASDGSFVFKDIPNGPFSLKSIHTAGYQDAIYNPQGGCGQYPHFSLAEGEQRTDVILKAEPAYSISGKVFGENGKPLKDSQLSVLAWVEVDDAGGNGNRYNIAKQARITKDGSYVLDGLDDRPVYVMVIDWRCQDKEEFFPPCYWPGTVARNEAEKVSFGKAKSVDDIDIYLTRQGQFTLEGTVTDETTGKAVPKTLVTIHHKDMLFDRLTAYTDEQGHYRVDSLGEGEFLVHVDAEPWGYVRTRKPVQINSEKITKLDFTLRSAIKISGKIVDEEGNPVEKSRRAYGLAYRVGYSTPETSSWSGVKNKYGMKSEGQGNTFNGGQGDYEEEYMDFPTASTFLITGMKPGKTMLRFHPKSQGKIVKEILYDGQNIIETGIETKPGEEIKDVTIVVADESKVKI